MQNADLIISLGSRLDTKSTGSPVNTFARDAYKIMVDIDINELSKFKHFDLKFDQLIHCDLKHFFLNLKIITSRPIDQNLNWTLQINDWKKLFFF